MPHANIVRPVVAMHKKHVHLKLIKIWVLFNFSWQHMFILFTSFIRQWQEHQYCYMFLLLVYIVLLLTSLFLDRYCIIIISTFHALFHIIYCFIEVRGMPEQDIESLFVLGFGAGVLGVK